MKTDRVDRVLRILVVVFAVAAVPLVAYAIIAGPVPTTGGGSGSINAIVNFDGTLFTIQNADTFDWASVTMEVNSTYDLQVAKMQAGQTYTYPASQFTRADGTHLDPVANPPTVMTITCTLPDGSTGSWTGHSP